MVQSRFFWKKCVHAVTPYIHDVTTHTSILDPSLSLLWPCLLQDAELEMLVVLRMNRRFMEFMRTNYPDLAKALAKQHFGYTTVEM